MPKVQLQLTVKPGPSVTIVSINIHGQPVALVNNRGSISLPSPGRYVVVWHFVGDEGETLGLTAEAGGNAVLSIKKSRVPSGENAGAGIARIEI